MLPQIMPPETSGCWTAGHPLRWGVFAGSDHPYLGGAKKTVINEPHLFTKAFLQDMKTYNRWVKSKQ